MSSRNEDWYLSEDYHRRGVSRRVERDLLGEEDIIGLSRLRTAGRPIYDSVRPVVDELIKICALCPFYDWIVSGRCESHAKEGAG